MNMQSGRIFPNKQLPGTPVLRNPCTGKASTMVTAIHGTIIRFLPQISTFCALNLPHPDLYKGSLTLNYGYVALYSCDIMPKKITETRL
jgi:hypothetical protein